jgi:hypothetical protein
LAVGSTNFAPPWPIVNRSPIVISVATTHLLARDATSGPVRSGAASATCRPMCKGGDARITALITSVSKQ